MYNIKYKILDDDHKLASHYYNKRTNAKKENINFNLSIDEYCELVSKANLKSSNLGFSGDNFVLARYNDIGDYSFDNCRFITQAENAKEKKISQVARNSSKQNAIKLNNYLKNIPGDIKSMAIKRGIQKSTYCQNRAKLKEIHLLEKESKKDKRYCKEHNSQYNTFWITDGNINMKWKSAKGELPKNFYKGRVLNNK